MYINKEKIPDYVINIARELINNGHKAYIVGGAVRDLILDRTPKDFDIATSALPDETLRIFPKSISTGAKFGSIVVIIENNEQEKIDVDITTFREEENYFGGRWPNKIKFTKNIINDLSRRDFTINALAIDINDLIDNVEINQSIIIDPFKGIEDISNKIIRAVGKPEDRFEEDGLRSYKACRLAAELSFSIEHDTLNAIYKKRSVASQISVERINQELKKLIRHSPKPSIGFLYLKKCGLLKIIIPELELTENIVQPKWHKNDLFSHSLETLDKAEDEIKVAALFHDIGKIKTMSIINDEIHFYGHAFEGSLLTKTILERLKFEKKEINEIENLIKLHMFDFELKAENSISDHGIKKFIINAGGIGNVNKLIKLRIADGSSTKSSFNPTEILELQNRINKIVEQNNIIEIGSLNITGQDLINLGYTKGPLIGKILNNLLELANLEPNTNTYHKLKDTALSRYPLN
ncbi:CCA tRNA nucleotidyltransferase [Candidatus Dojkabacteria bacterium]|nr:CCA tRNA nucleotidyltransferase [Candidatus Dojkabacteria bacterium]